MERPTNAEKRGVWRFGAVGSSAKEDETPKGSEGELGVCLLSRKQEQRRSSWDRVSSGRSSQQGSDLIRERRTLLRSNRSDAATGSSEEKRKVEGKFRGRPHVAQPPSQEAPHSTCVRACLTWGQRNGTRNHRSHAKANSWCRGHRPSTANRLAPRTLISSDHTNENIRPTRFPREQERLSSSLVPYLVYE